MSVGGTAPNDSSVIGRAVTYMAFAITAASHGPEAKLGVVGIPLSNGVY